MTNPWESLATQAREIAALADEYATRAAADLAPTADAFDALADLDGRAQAVVSAVGACRRHTFMELEKQGVTRAEIARMWGKSRSYPGKVIDNPDRKR